LRRSSGKLLTVHQAPNSLQVVTHQDCSTNTPQDDLILNMLLNIDDECHKVIIIKLVSNIEICRSIEDVLSSIPIIQSTFNKTLVNWEDCTPSYAVDERASRNHTRGVCSPYFLPRLKGIVYLPPSLKINPTKRTRHCPYCGEQAHCAGTGTNWPRVSPRAHLVVVCCWVCSPYFLPWLKSIVYPPPLLKINPTKCTWHCHTVEDKRIALEWAPEGHGWGQRPCWTIPRL
jgi:hypothetical protein